LLKVLMPCACWQPIQTGQDQLVPPSLVDFMVAMVVQQELVGQVVVEAAVELHRSLQSTAQSRLWHQVVVVAVDLD
jgi:hypothetical protein